MRIRKSTPIGGAATQPGESSPGSAWRSGCGTSAWNWGITWSRLPCVPPSLLLPCRRRVSRLPRVRPHPLLPLDTVHLPLPPASENGALHRSRLPLQPNGTLRCPAGQSLSAQEHRREADGSLRVVYAASIRSCRPCPLRERCQWQGRATKKPRQVSVLLHPLVIGNEPLLWRDWSRREHRHACIELVRHQHIEVRLSPPAAAQPSTTDVILSRALRTHSRLSWQERLACNTGPPTAGHLTIQLFGIPTPFAAALGLATA
jgi:hypothetical protein